MVIRSITGLLASRLGAVLLAISAILTLPAAARAACASEEAAARAEWNAMPHGMEFDDKMAEMNAIMRGDSMWNNVEELRSVQAEVAQDGYYPPKNRVYLACLIGSRIAELESGAHAPARSTAGGPSNFATGGDEPADVADKPEAKPSEPGCGLVAGDSSLGALSSETVNARNTCTSQRVSYAYCVTSANGGGAFSCTEGHFGTDSVSPGGQKYFSVVNASSPFMVHWGYCVASPDNPDVLAVNPRWDGSKVHVDCH